MAGITCISNDGKEYASGSLNAAGTHRCRDGKWDKVKTAMEPSVGTTETGLKEPIPLIVTVKEVITITEKVLPIPKEKKTNK
ncbi:MAG: hypothetical protein HUU34_20380 [Saprospiraceae bacterium]|nr:hypothetical protein [Saprospiraceae bacterium]